MAKLKIYEYANCSTCKNALKFLERGRVAFERHSIVETPPSRAELKRMIGFLGGDFRKLFNTSGLVYREMGLGAKIKNGLTEDEALALLAANGKLIKRPFVVGDKFGMVGFKEAEWKKVF